MRALMRTRRVTAVALNGAAFALVNTGRLVKLAADAVRPSEVSADEGAETRPGAVEPPPQVPIGAPDDPLSVTRARTAPTNIADLAERPASEVIELMDGLSTDELRLLLEHEQAHRRRKSVLAAIEQAAAQHVPS